MREVGRYEATVSDFPNPAYMDPYVLCLQHWALWHKAYASFLTILYLSRDLNVWDIKVIISYLKHNRMRCVLDKLISIMYLQV